MKKTLLFVLAASIISIFTVSDVFTNAGDPPLGRTGAPSEGTCGAGGNCHAGPASDGTAALTLTAAHAGGPAVEVDNSFEYAANETYEFMLTLNEGSRFGFEMVALDMNESNVGGFTATDSRTRVRTQGGREYIAHKNADGTNNWTFDWSAPATGRTAINFYIVGNAANNNGNSGGDEIFTRVITVNEATATGIEDHTQDLHLNLYPNPALGGAVYLRYHIYEFGDVQAKLIGMDGRVMHNFFHEPHQPGYHERYVDLPENLSGGVYMLELQGDQSRSVSRLVIQ